jgi:2-polyprenyl-6-methoxyphenol hydroxylase-like FAD-dependent oxidoreductase
LTALLLTNAHIPTLVLEALPAIEYSPRAAVYQPVAVKELDRAGILDKCRSIGFSGSEIVWRKAVSSSSCSYSSSPSDSNKDNTEGKNSEVILSMNRRPSPEEPYENLVLGQHELAAVILEDFMSNGGFGKILFNHRVVGVKQDREKKEEGVIVRTEIVENDDDKTEKKERVFRAQYLVGADGGKSFVRRHLGLSFDGFTWERPIVATNVMYPFDKFGMATGNFVVYVLSYLLYY